jgi:dTDP-4-amino-4,6-dideoxygalactose transaminase
MALPRETFLPFALPDIGDEEIAEVTEVLRSGWVTTGPKTREFERLFADYVGARHAVAVNSCTAALHLALEAIGLGPNDRVVTTPYTFAATAEVIRYFQATPVFVDVEPDTLNMDPARLEEAVAGAKAVIPVHIAGAPCRLREIADIARRHGARVIDDAAHALPTRLDGTLIGTGADATCFSFYATKSLTTGEGGMLCTDDDAIADRCRIMSLHGISRDAWKRYMADGSWYYEIVAPGYKYNLTDVAAALGLAQLRKVEAMWKRRQEIARRYDDAFAEMTELQLPTHDEAHQHAWHLYMLRLHLDRLDIDRAAFITELKRRNIGASVHFIPLHSHPYYRDTFGYRPEDLPIAWREYQREVSLPIYSRMSDGDIDDVIAAVREIVGIHRLRRPGISA